MSRRQPPRSLKPNLNLAGSQEFIYNGVFNEPLFVSHHEAGFKCHSIFTNVRENECTRVMSFR